MQKTVVIVGGGLIGLSTAYHTALTCHSVERACRVTVLDAADIFWDKSSAYNTGSVKGQFPDGERRQLAQYSYNMFRRLSKRDDFLRRTSIKDHTCYTVSADGNVKPQALPRWVNVKSN